MILPNGTYLFLICVLSTVLVRTEGERKSKRTKEARNQLPKYEVYASDQLPNDKQITTFLYKGETKTFYYWSSLYSAPLSITIITCTSPVHWIIKHGLNNSSNEDVRPIQENTSSGMKTYHLTALKGRYALFLSSTEKDTYVHVYVSTEKGGPQALQNSNLQEIKLFKRQRRKRLTARWDPSLVDPQVTDYCLVVSTRSHYDTLCQAQGDRYGIIPTTQGKPMAASQTVITSEDKNLQREPFISCVGPNTHYTLSNLKQGQKYFFNLFAINRQSNFTYPYGSAFKLFDTTVKPTSLRDGKATFVNLKKLDGKAILRFKVGKKSGKSLELYLMPCGGAIDVEISLKRNVIETKRGIEGFGRIVIPNPKEGGRYYIKILTSYREELRKQSGVELYCTTKSSSKIPLPTMPAHPTVQEYVSLRKCDSVTVGWYASPVQKIAHYCLVVKEGQLREMEGYRMPNQCGLENRLKKSADFAAKYCRDFKHSASNQVIVQKINQLKPGKFYIVQVTVKKPKGKTLSYELLQVQTKPSCARS